MTVLWRMAIATLTLLIPMTALVRPSLAQTVTEAQADAWFEEAEALEEQGEDFDAVIAAYERALDAYRSLGDQSNSLKVLEDLFALTYTACQYEQAIAWAEQALELFPAPETSMNPTDDGNYHKSWTETLGWLYRRQGQIEQAIATYRAGLQFLENLPPSAEADLRADLEADLLRGLLVAHSIADSDGSSELESLQQQLIEASQRAGVIRQLERLLSDLRFMNREPGRSPESLNFILDTSRQYDYASGELQALMMLGHEAWRRGELEAAIAQGEAALSLAEQFAESDAYMITIAGSLARLYEELGQVEQVARLQQAYGDMTMTTEGDWALPSYSEPLQVPLPRFSPVRLPPLFARMSPRSVQCDRPAVPAPFARPTWMEVPRVDSSDRDSPGVYLRRPPEPDPVPY